MKIDFKRLSSPYGEFHVELSKRLPKFMNAPCKVDCEYRIEPRESYHLLHLNMAARPCIICQRCMVPFEDQFNWQGVIAVCYNEAMESNLIEQYDCILCEEGVLDLSEVLTDNLHFYLPKFHENAEDCVMPSSIHIV